MAPENLPRDVKPFPRLLNAPPVDGRGVKFTYRELPEDGAFITAQLVRSEVVYSVV
jgi:hypothetical protein